MTRRLIDLLYRLRHAFWLTARWVESELEIDRLRQELRISESKRLAAEKETTRQVARNSVMRERNTGLTEALGEAYAELIGVINDGA